MYLCLKCVKVVHPKEAIDQIGLVQQQIKFDSVLKLKKSLLDADNEQKFINLIASFIQK
jgi:hypothetical protein